jgi:zinc protease
MRSMSRALLPLLLATILLTHAPRAEAETRRTLDNGLQVIVEARPGASETGVALAYRVGQQDDPPGCKGLAYLAEHMAFRGSRHLPGLSGYARIAEVGGRTNATTRFDTTVYTHSVPSSEVARALWVESDRTGFMMEALAAENLGLEQRIVGRELDLRRGVSGQGNRI